jgi:hypothetical protein
MAFFLCGEAALIVAFFLKALGSLLFGRFAFFRGEAAPANFTSQADPPPPYQNGNKLPASGRNP